MILQPIVDLRNRLIALNVQIFLLLMEVYNDPLVKAQIEDKIIEQLSRGERGDGSKMPYYSPVSVAKFNKPAGPIKLFDQGGFYRGVTVEVTREGIIIYDTDDKSEMLEIRYGSEILELQEGSIDELNRDVIIPALRARILEYLKGSSISIAA
jgi:hypothetical protein